MSTQRRRAYRRTMLAVGVATGLALALPSLGAAPVIAAAHPKPVTVNDTGPSTLLDRLTPLVGTASAIVYERFPQWAAAYPDGANNPIPAALVARTTSGTNILPTGRALPFNRGWSLDGNLLTAYRRLKNSQIKSGIKPGVDWWNIDTGEHGLLAPAAYRSSGPGGIVEEGPNGSLVLEKLDGSKTTVGTPFGGVASVSAVIPGPTGLVAVRYVGAGSSLAYIPWDDPNGVVPLDDGDTSTGEGPPRCSVVGASYVACLVPRDNGGPVFYDPSLIPLNGDTATDAPMAGTGGFQCTPGAALDRDVLVYIATDGCGGTTGPQVSFLSAGSSTPTHAAPKLDGPVLSGPDGAVLLDSAQTMVLATPPSTISDYIGATPSPTTVASFELGPNRVVYVDDGPVPDTATGTVLRSTALTTHRSKLEVRTTKALYPAPGAYFVHGPTTVFSSNLKRGFVVIHDGHRKVYPLHGSLVGAGGRWVLVFHHRGKLTALNVATGKTRTVTTGVPYVGNVEYGGGDFAAILSDKGVRIVNIRTGTRRWLVHRLTAVTASGNWFAWRKKDSGTYWLQNVAKRGPITTLSSHFAYLTPKGALIADAGKLFLRGYGGATHRLALGHAPLLAYPQVVGSLVAWLDENGDLKAAALSTLLK